MKSIRYVTKSEMIKHPIGEMLLEELESIEKINFDQEIKIKTNRPITLRHPLFQAFNLQLEYMFKNREYLLIIQLDK